MREANNSISPPTLAKEGRYDWFQRLVAGVCAILLTVYVISLIWMYSLPVWASDEIAFFKWADMPVNNSKGAGIWAFLTRPNSAGYGVIYWNIYILLKSWFGSDAMWTMRVLALIAWLSIPISTLLVGNATRRNLGWLLAMLWISMPIAWWSGKFTGPETFSLAFAYCGIMLIQLVHLRVQKSEIRFEWALSIFAWFLIGIGIGFKLTMLPALVFALVIAYCPRPNTRFVNARDLVRFACTACFSLALGFVVANPVLIFDRATFFSELGNLPRGEAWSWFIAKLTLSNEVWSWDGVFSAGLVQWSLVPVTMGLLIAIAFVIRVRNALALLAAFLTCWGIIVSTGSTLGWYWFGLIAMTIPALMWSVESSTRYRVIAPTIALVAIVNGYCQANYIREQIAIKIWQGQAYDQLPDLQKQVTKLMTVKKYDVVIDYSEITLNRALLIDSGAGTEVVQMSPPFIPGLTEGWEQKAEELGHEAFQRGSHMILSDAFVRIVQLAENGSEGKSILLIISKRLASKQPFADFERFWKDQVQPKCPPNTELIRSLDLANTVIFEIRTGK